MRFAVSEGTANSERRPSMALYALQTAYAPVGWAPLLKDPQNRMEAVKPVVQRLGRRLLEGLLPVCGYNERVLFHQPAIVRAPPRSQTILSRGSLQIPQTPPSDTPT